MNRIYFLILAIIFVSQSLFAHEGKESFVLKEVSRIHLEIFTENPSILDTKKLSELLKGEADLKKDTEAFRKALPISEELGKTKDLSKKREIFQRLSNELIPIIGNHDKSGVSVFYCPMLKKKWLASGNTIQNPYDSKMKTCGEIVREAD